MAALVNARTEDAIAGNATFALTRATRRRGLLGRDAIDPAEALVIAPCCSIHTAFMRFAIDAIFVDRDGLVLRVASSVAPWRVVIAPRAHAVIELAAGRLESHPVTVGDCLYVRTENGPASLSDALLSMRRMVARPAGPATVNA
jgi:uncharacterized protein